ncbi:MAG: bile acid:sodium symporter family protein [Gemmatimonadaceae bacterium]|nr:bile acid:sodium symporter family protein [Gemmatimonadaceae bacterium]
MNDALPLRFDPSGLIALNAIIALMVLGASLDLRVADLRRVAARPAGVLAGLSAQAVLTPAATCLLSWVFRVDPALSLGMMLVAACPSGALSNVLTWRARGNVALSVGLTTVSSLAAIVLTPLNFALYGWLNPRTRPLLQAVALPVGGILAQVALVLALPVLAGMLIGSRAPRVATRAERPLRGLSFLVLIAFIGGAFWENRALFVARFGDFFWLVVLQNALALAIGRLVSRVARLDEADTRAVTIEVGIHNSGLGLAILMTFFPAAGSMMLITAFWGVWHLVSGLALSSWWSRRPPPPRVIATAAGPDAGGIAAAGTA